MEQSSYLENFYGFQKHAGFDYFLYFFDTRLTLTLRKPSSILLSMMHVIADQFSNSFWEHKRAIWIFYRPMRDRDLEWHLQVQYKVMTIFVIGSYSL